MSVNNTTAPTEPDPQSELSGYGLIQVDGTDACTFLQGQLSANIDIMQQGETVWAAHCNPKGRIIANFFIYRHGDNRFLLLLPAANIPVALQNLKKYAVFSKVSVEDVSASYQLSALIEPEALPAAAPETAAPVIRINETLAAACIKTESVTEQAAIPAGSKSDDEAWKKRLIEAGFALVVPATSGEIIPQMLNMDLLGGISFNKGCYTGQEVIARLKYKGEIKRRCYRFSIQLNDSAQDCPLSVTAGDPLVNEKGQTVGIVVSSALNDSVIFGLAVVKTATIEEKAAVFVTNLRGSEHKLPCKIDPELPPYAINN